MSDQTEQKNRASDVIVKGLQSHGTKRLYCVPGESYLTLLDSLYDSSKIETIVCRHESGAGFMALAEAKLTGKAGVFAVSRGPGATNGSIALHVAEQDGVPLICLIGQVSRAEKGKDAFQEMNYFDYFGSVCKAVFEPSQGDDVANVLAQAILIAESGTPGPVVISMPEDMLADYTQNTAQLSPAETPSKAKDNQSQQLLDLIAAAKQPLIFAGNQMRGEKPQEALSAFAEKFQIPVVCGWKAQDVFDNYNPLYGGHIGFGAPLVQKELYSRADLIIAVGSRLGDVSTMNYAVPLAPKPLQPLVHINQDKAQIGKVYDTDLAICADVGAFLSTMLEHDTVANKATSDWVNEVKQFVDEFMTFTSVEPDDGVDFGKVVTAAATLAPDDAIIITDSGNFSSWVHRYWRLGKSHTMLGAVGGAMGFGVPGAVGAALTQPDRMVICVVGDGGILMTGQEIATAVQYGAKPKIILSDNGIYGTIRTHQEKRFSGRVNGTNLKNPDFAKWADSFGVQSLTINLGDDVEAVLKQMLDHDGPSVVHVHSSAEALSAFTTLSALTNA